MDITTKGCCTCYGWADCWEASPLVWVEIDIMDTGVWRN
jgi:hypothetical protein